MSDPTTADELAAVFADAAETLAEAFHPDTCQILRGTERVPDGYGGWTEVPAEHGEPFRCRLDTTQRIGTEGASGARVLAISSYSVEVPVDADIRPTDRLRVNGREFEVTDPKRGGHHELFAVIGVEERS